jgi:hypothetical protein
MCQNVVAILLQIYDCFEVLHGEQGTVLGEEYHAQFS